MVLGLQGLRIFETSVLSVMGGLHPLLPHETRDGPGDCICTAGRHLEMTKTCVGNLTQVLCFGGVATIERGVTNHVKREV